MKKLQNELDSMSIERGKKKNLLCLKSDKFVLDPKPVILSMHDEINNYKVIVSKLNARLEQVSKPPDSAVKMTKSIQCLRKFVQQNKNGQFSFASLSKEDFVCDNEDWDNIVKLLELSKTESTDIWASTNPIILEALMQFFAYGCEKESEVKRLRQRLTSFVDRYEKETKENIKLYAKIVKYEKKLKKLEVSESFKNDKTNKTVNHLDVLFKTEADNTSTLEGKARGRNLFCSFNKSYQKKERNKSCIDGKTLLGKSPIFGAGLVMNIKKEKPVSVKSDSICSNKESGFSNFFKKK